MDLQKGDNLVSSICLTNLLTTLEMVTKNVDDGNCVDLIYFDYKKALDKVAHHRLLCKLKSLGLS